MENALASAVVMAAILLISFGFIFGGRKGPARLLQAVFAPGTCCLQAALRAIVGGVVLIVVFAIMVSHVLAPGSIKLPFLPAPEKPKPDPHIAWHFDYPVGSANADGRFDGGGWRVSQDFLDRLNAYKPDQPYHLGEDWTCAGCAEKPVRAIAGGFVIVSGANKSYGHLVMIRHPLPGGSELSYVVSLYGHMSARELPPAPQSGREFWVERGAIIGYVGKKGENGSDKSGNPWAEHLHFELRADSNQTGKPDSDPNIGYNSDHRGFLNPTNATSRGNEPGDGWIDAHRDIGQ